MPVPVPMPLPMPVPMPMNVPVPVPVLFQSNDQKNFERKIFLEKKLYHGVIEIPGFCRKFFLGL